MKRLFCMLTALILLLSACTGRAGDEATFRATVLEVHEGYYLVEPVEGSAELKSSDRMTVSRKNISPSPEPEVGDTLEIEYDGYIAESYPAQINVVYSVRVVE